MTNYELSEFAKEISEKIANVSQWPYYLNGYDALEFVQRARRYKRNSKDEPFHQVMCFNEETKQIQCINITYKNTLKEFILILIAAEKHFLTKQQIKAFIKEYRNEKH